MCWSLPIVWRLRSDHIRPRKGRWHHFTCGHRLAVYIGLRKETIGGSGAGAQARPTERRIMIARRLVLQGHSRACLFLGCAEGFRCRLDKFPPRPFR